MIYIQAFLFSGIACAVAQFIFRNTKLGVIGTLSLVMAVGVIAGMVNVFGSWVQFGMMGVILNIMGLSNQFFDSLSLLFRGAMFNFIAFVILLCCILIFGSICAALAKLPPAPPKE